MLRSCLQALLESFGTKFSQKMTRQKGGSMFLCLLNYFFGPASGKLSPSFVVNHHKEINEDDPTSGRQILWCSKEPFGWVSPKVLQQTS